MPSALAPYGGRLGSVSGTLLSMNRRNFLAVGASGLAAACGSEPSPEPDPADAAAPPSFRPLVGLELYSVRQALEADLTSTLDAVAGMGCQVVEFYSPYFDWTNDYARQVR